MAGTIGPLLVTGGCGFIGVNLLARLRGTGTKVRILDNLETGRESWAREAAPDAELVRGDIRDEAAVSRAVRGVDAVVHLAASPGVQQSVESPQTDFDVNVRGLLIVLDASRRAGVKRFVFASSNAAVGPLDGPSGAGIVPKPISPYGAGKLAGEGYCSAFRHSYGMETLAVRFANCYGPYSSHKTSVVARFLDRILAGRPLVVYGDGRQTRDFVYAGDIAQALARALEAPRLGGEVVQAGSGRETSVLELVETLRRVTGRALDVVHEPERPADVRRSVSDLAPARALLGYAPEVPLEEGLRRTWQWYSAASLQRG